MRTKAARCREKDGPDGFLESSPPHALRCQPHHFVNVHHRTTRRELCFDIRSGRGDRDHLFVLTAITGREHVRKQVVAIGPVGSFFYLYGIFTIERVYNSFYLIYAAVFALSFWSIVASLAGFEATSLGDLRLSKRMLEVTAFSSIFIAVLFTILWIVALVPLMRDRDRIDHLYSIHILDLCFVMPAFVITAVMSLRRMPLGSLMPPAVMILGFFVIFPLRLNELAKPSAGMAIDYGPMVVSFAFAFFMLALGVLQLSRIRFDDARRTFASHDALVSRTARLRACHAAYERRSSGMAWKPLR